MRTHLGGSPARLRDTARVLLVALSVTTLGPVLHGVHDAERQSLVVLHDESQHHFQTAPARSEAFGEAEHCVACHFARSSRGPASWVPSGLHVIDGGNLLQHSDGPLQAAPSAPPTPARAPPVFA